jgi:hypothetical protein
MVEAIIGPLVGRLQEIAVDDARATTTKTVFRIS